MADLPPALLRESVERRQLSSKVRGEQRREQVLERLVDVFAKRGYQAATVDHLIAGGKLSMGSFYKDFKGGKEDCFVQVYDRILADLRERLEAAVAPRSAWVTRTAVGVRTVVEFAGERPMAARVVLLEAQTGGEEALGRYNAAMKEIAAFLRRGRPKGAAGRQQLPNSFEEATVAGLAWLLQSRLAEGRIEDVAELWPQMARMALEPYLGAAEAEKVLRPLT